ncbi:glycosyltransferase family 4 protein [[Clostridium] fimetarium]|uniref:Glycosyltransferase involved in cell wall bisynthesis n=1 Tax=[Clostridium] fimetarium TaxID=99656 RepID=A0A1I0RN32_9FIRM|nr:glycosyltransferase family 4 protein [[Clostridium] fimetarium]SEW42614.1 Glycosyltransferase involved in cell wall bisynthesis [[Clostridium] fimetarium]
MKIAMIGHKRIPSREGGVEIVVEEISKRLVELGHSVYVYNRSGHHISGKNFDDDSNNHLKVYEGIRIIMVPTIDKKGLSALIYSGVATFIALFGHYDCIHFHAEGPCAMIWLPHLFGIRTVATIHGLDWQRAKWNGFATKYLKFGEKMAAKYADEVIVLSNNVHKYFLDTYGRDTNFISNGISKPKIIEAGIIEKKWNLKRNEYFLFLGRLVPEKGLYYLVDAFRNISTLKKLVIAGGSSDTNDYIVDIKRKAAEDSRIVFTDFVQGEVLEELYSNAYVYVLPSDLEGMPISLLEAMSYGNCCLVSNIPECAEVVEDKAVVFNKSDVVDLSEKLEYLVNNTQIVDRYKQEASKFICGRYNWDEIVKRTTELYRGERNPIVAKDV